MNSMTKSETSRIATSKMTQAKSGPISIPWKVKFQNLSKRMLTVSGKFKICRCKMLTFRTNLRISKLRGIRSVSRMKSWRDR